MARRINYKLGDVFLVPLNDHVYGVGRILRKVQECLLLEFYYMKPIHDIDEYNYAKVSEHPPLYTKWAYHQGIRKGLWPIIDHQEVPDVIDMPYFVTQDLGTMKFEIGKGLENDPFSVKNSQWTEIPEKERHLYVSNGVGNEFSEVIRYKRKLTEAGLMEVDSNPDE